MSSDLSSETVIPEQIRRYFALAAQPDREAYFAQFRADALVEDESRDYHGIDAIRTWRREVPRVSYRIKAIQHRDQPGARGHDARVEIAGEFPGSPVELTFHFEFDPVGKLQVLTIRS
jgi:hypothetical protein